MNREAADDRLFHHFFGWVFHDRRGGLAMNRDDVKISKHALQRLFVRGISVAEALSAIENGEVIMEYLADRSSTSHWGDRQ
jgi:hypothetical protein